MDSHIKQFSSFDSASRVPEYQKDEGFEAAIERLNVGDDIQLSELDSCPPIIIISPPRSGSTYLNQIMASTLDIGYCSNLMAAFYQKPVLGATLQQQLIGQRIAQLSEYNSEFGVTKLIEEPHEFGYFWSRHLQFSEQYHQPENINELDSIDWSALNSELRQVSNVFARPTLFKCSVGVFMVEQILANIDALVLWVDRPAIDNCRSILTAREKRLGSTQQWWSVRPRDFEDTQKLPPEHQVEWQFNQMHNALLAAGDKVGARMMRIDFSDLMSNQHKIIRHVVSRYEHLFSIKITERGALS